MQPIFFPSTKIENKITLGPILQKEGVGKVKWSNGDKVIMILTGYTKTVVEIVFTKA